MRELFAPSYVFPVKDADSWGAGLLSSDLPVGIMLIDVRA